jgi:hypothetical protein
MVGDVNLLKAEWTPLESDDLRALLQDRIGGVGQCSGEEGDHRLYIPQWGPTCRLKIRFKGNRIAALEPGEAFNQSEWLQISAAIDALINASPNKFGRDIAFSGRRVTGWWHGPKSGVQILPPPAGASAMPTELGEHPFILEFPIHADDKFTVTNARRRREARKLSLLLNVLLPPGVSFEPRQTESAWCRVGPETNDNAWLQLSYFADLGDLVKSSISESDAEPIEAIPTEEYYRRMHVGDVLRVPCDLDEAICRYRALGQDDREKVDRALFWLDVASRQWTTSMSSSFASLVSAIESLTERGCKHRLYCDKCGRDREHDEPGPTELFRDFLETYARGTSLKKRRNEMYALRSGILHGDRLISFDEGRAFGWDPPWRDQNELHTELWGITRIAVRNYMLNPGAKPPPLTTQDAPMLKHRDQRTVNLRPTQILLAGIALGALVAVGGRYSARYSDAQAARQAKRSADIASELSACLARYFAEHPDREAPKHEGLTLSEAAGLTDHTGASIPCQGDRLAAAKASAEDAQRYGSFVRHWWPRLAGALLAIFSAPFLWQFLLRRIAEIGAAFRGHSLK